MASDRDRLDKVLAIAVNPGAYETEAVAALRAARQLIKKNPALAHPPLHPRVPPKPAPLGEQSHQVRITNIAPFWLYIAINSLSQQAYGLGLKSKIVIDFKAMPYALDVRCDGAETACDAFARYVDRLIDYINSQPRRPSLAS
jgi:hypothetical protein